MLIYSTDAVPGISRHSANDGFGYRDARGSPLRDAATLARIDALVIPPAWSQVWICCDPDGHLQVTGRDARGRKQYRYHADWTAAQHADKFDALEEFALALPRIRRRVARDLKRGSLDKDRVLAAIVQLIDRTFIRVGGERYRRENGSFGATTLRNRHVKVAGDEIFLDFRGKSGQNHRIELRDRRVASVIRRCLDVPGQLFSYPDGGETRSIAAADVNDYLDRISGAAITSKDFRTWGGSVAAASVLARAVPARSKSEVRRRIREAVLAASRLLGNTPAVCRRSYIHPSVFANYEAGMPVVPCDVRGLRRAECALLGILRGTTERRQRKARAPTADATLSLGAWHTSR